MYDDEEDGVQAGNHLKIGVLGYTDDAALVSTTAEKLSERVSIIAAGSRAAADMEISIAKTKNLHIRQQTAIKPSTRVEVLAMQSTFKHECKFCDQHFKSSRGCKIHEAACNHQHQLSEEVFNIDSINAVLAHKNTADTECDGRDSRVKTVGSLQSR